MYLFYARVRLIVGKELMVFSGAVHQPRLSWGLMYSLYFHFPARNCSALFYLCRVNPPHVSTCRYHAYQCHSVPLEIPLSSIGPISLTLLLEFCTGEAFSSPACGERYYCEDNGSLGCLEYFFAHFGRGYFMNNWGP